MKIGDKIEVLKRNDTTSNSWITVGKGVVKKIYVNSIGEQSFVGFSDKNWTNCEVEEIIPVNANCLKIKFI